MTTNIYWRIIVWSSMTRPQEKDISAKTGLIECHKKETAARMLWRKNKNVY